ncbi:MAG TPA: NADH-quinone oxidoreductase subunit M [Myxococcota bacterium]|nr:NADH-quinone oxidoreductase subunit M [Myxococcota bacterium]
MSLLVVVVLIPVLGAAAVGAVPRRLEGWHHRVAVAAALVELVAVLGVVAAFDPARSDIQLRAMFPWTVQVGAPSALGVDGLSLPLVGLASLLFLSALRASVDVRNPRSFHAWMLLLEAAVLGVLLARDWALFYACWELTLVPSFVLVARWGGPRRGAASIAFLQYTMGGSVFTLLALLGLMASAGLRTTSMDTLAEAAHRLPVDLQAIAFVGLCVGFAVKLSVFPLHGWLPLADVEASSTVAMVLSGVLMKLGAYGLLRAAATLPGGAQIVAPALGALGALGVVYGALLAWRQDDLGAVAAYGTMSHMGMVVLSIATLDPLGWVGVTQQMVAHGCSAALLFQMVGALQGRAGTRSLAAFGGLAVGAPRLAALIAFALIGSTALPGLAGFPGELYAVLALLERWPWAVVPGLLGGLIWAAAAVRALDRVLLGPVRGALVGVDDARGPELQAALPLALGLLVLGVLPAALSSWGEATVRATLRAIALSAAGS